ncbi:MAG: NAD(P)/FAD-dependent oxidoreductase [Anaerolineales bacterium]
MYDLIIVGGGPAGLTAMIYAIRKRLNALLVSKDLGGKTMWRLELPWVEEYQVIKGLEVVNKFKSELEYLSFARHMEAVEKVEKRGDIFTVITKGGGELTAKAVIIASGTKQKRIGVPGEKEFLMRGLCYSALSYAPLFIERKTAVIGDGDLALRSAAELATVAQHVSLVGITAKSLQTTLGQKLQRSENVRILQDYQVLEVKGDRFADKLVLKSPSGKIEELEVEGTFIEMGLIPNAQMVEGLVALDDQGRICVDCFCRTNVTGIFAAGDVTDIFAEQVLIAVGEGAKAALSAYEYLLPQL